MELRLRLGMVIALALIVGVSAAASTAFLALDVAVAEEQTLAPSPERAGSDEVTDPPAPDWLLPAVLGAGTAIALRVALGSVWRRRRGGGKPGGGAGG